MLVLADGPSNSVAVPLIPLEILLIVLAIVAVGVVVFFIIGYIRGLVKVQIAIQNQMKEETRELRGYIFQIAQNTGTRLPEQSVEDYTPVYPDRWGGMRGGLRVVPPQASNSRPLRYGTGD